MPLHTETRAGGRVIQADESGRIVSYSEVRNGIEYFYSASGEVLEIQPVAPPRHWICTACGWRCEVRGYTAHPDACRFGAASNWIEILPQTTLAQDGAGETK